MPRGGNDRSRSAPGILMCPAKDSYRSRGSLRLKLESPPAHHQTGDGIIALSGTPYISTEQVDGMTFPRPTHDRRAGGLIY